MQVFHRHDRGELRLDIQQGRRQILVKHSLDFSRNQPASTGAQPSCVRRSPLQPDPSRYTERRRDTVAGVACFKSRISKIMRMV